MNTENSKLMSPNDKCEGLYAPPFKECQTFSRHQLWIRPPRLSQHCIFLSLSISPTTEILAQFCTQWPANRFPRFLAQISQPFPRQGQILFSSNLLVEPVMELHQIPNLQNFAVFGLKKAFFLFSSYKCIFQFHDLLPHKGKRTLSGWSERELYNPPPCLLSSSILYIAFLRFVYVHIIPRPHSFAYSIYI